MTLYDRNSPYLAKVTIRHRLNKAGSTKETWHVALDLSDSGISYRPGDSFGIFPENDPELVQSILDTLGTSGEEEVLDLRNLITLPFREWLIRRANVAVCSRKLLQELALRLPPGSKKEHLEIVLLPGNEDMLKQFLSLWNVPEILAMHREAKLLPPELVNSLQPLLPRFYSIASSQNDHPDEVHLVVSRVRYEVEGRKRAGICSHFLCDLINPGEKRVPVYVQQTKEFLLPTDHETPIIMIGPGTGIAPFRAFMQERKSSRKNWLFFGERNQAYDFFYEEFWQGLVQREMLRISCAFSRDQQDKVYVQHKLWEERHALWHWLQEGAKLYVCGDAERMAKDVDQTLQAIAIDQGALSQEAAKSFFSSMRKEKRYLRDVY